MANSTRSVLVVGLGRFGSSVATTLDMMGQDVLAVDKDGELVNRWSSQIPTVQRIGARHIINAETDAGKRVGHLVSGNYLDYIELEGAYNVVKIHTPPHVVGYTIGDARVHERFGITVVGIKSPGKEFEYGSKELIMHRNDELIIMGKQDQIDRFARG